MNFGEFLDALVEAGLEELAVQYVYDCFIPLGLKGMEADEILGLPMERFLRELRKPEDIPGWNTGWGKHIVCG